VFGTVVWCVESLVSWNHVPERYFELFFFGHVVELFSEREKYLGRHSVYMMFSRKESWGK